MHHRYDRAAWADAPASERHARSKSSIYRVSTVADCRNKRPEYVASRLSSQFGVRPV